MKPLGYLSLLLLAMSLLAIVAANTSPKQLPPSVSVEDEFPNPQTVRHLNNQPQYIPEWIRASKWPQNYKFDNPGIEDLTGDEEPLRSYQIMPYAINFLGTGFYLFATWATSQHKLVGQISYNNQASLNAISTAKCPKLFVFIHGFGGGLESKPGCLTRDAEDCVRKKAYCVQSVIESILCYEENACVLVVDWSSGASPATLHALVLDAEHRVLFRAQAANAIVVGRQTAFLLYLLVTQGKINANNIHLMGHSVGGRTTHFTGQYYTQLMNTSENRRKYPQKLGRITGLDIATPNFERVKTEDLTKEDAAFVDLIHTTGGGHNGPFGIISASDPGSYTAIGHVDFFPNDANDRRQVPGCADAISFLLAGSNPVCAHYKSVDYMADSFNTSIPRSKFRSVNCRSYSGLRTCMRTASPSSFGSMGRDAPNFPGRGIQYLRYSSELPFTMG